MATVTIAHHPELTAESAEEAFKSHFAGKYEVYKPWMIIGADFVVKKSGWTGVAVKLRHGRENTSFRFGGTVPSMTSRMLFGGLIAILFLRPSWKAMEEEVRVFIENAADFK